MERQIYNSMRRIEQDHWWFRARRAILADQLEQLNLKAGARILEVGCGTGGNLEMLSRFGQVSAIEPDAESRAYASEKSGVPIAHGFLPGPLPAFEAGFDLIAALDVIEHLDEDAASVAALAGLLAPGGRMLTTVPAYPWMWSAHDLAHHHKRRYRKADYLKLFEAAGLRVTRASHFNAALFPPIALVRLVMGKGGSGGGEALPPAPLNGLLRWIFAAERHVLRRLDIPFGVSILVVAERPA